ncbi:hypothetical protein TRFO_12767 [Tritrichomonas foetus]|uniref:Uncharacterized protein n=1 Tax=Tritrichomonas foetus TaxID=1144522 RepID=A0A1J4L0V7_9EUKA|nr:hypothetical protein TRFO_12767 [Tritrichomonas foetus]|eukprot:OHT17050.1 hypothetical protein TRFO_12767 [Tritrichomonas foetus]
MSLTVILSRENRMDDLYSFLIHITSPSSHDQYNLDSFKSSQKQINQRIISLNSNLNEVGYAFNQMNAQLQSMYLSNPEFSKADIQSSLQIINQIFDSYKPLLLVAKNKPPPEPENQCELNKLYWQFINSTVKCLKNMVLPKSFYLQIYATLTPLLCIYLKKSRNNLSEISQSDFKVLIQQYEESADAVLHFLSETRFEIYVEKLINQFMSFEKIPESEKLYFKLVESLDVIKSMLIPKPQKSETYKSAIVYLADFRHNLTLYFENTTVREVALIFSTVSQMEGILRSFKLAFLSKEALKAMYKIVVNHDVSLSSSVSQPISRKFCENLQTLYIQEITALHKHNLIDDIFISTVKEILKFNPENNIDKNHLDNGGNSIDYRNFIKSIPDYFETSVIDDMQRSFSDLDISITKLQNFNDCLQMYTEFSRESDDFHKGGALHHNLMKNLILSESEVVFDVCVEGLADSDSKYENQEIEIIDNLISILGDFSFKDNKPTNNLFKYLHHILQVIRLAFTSLKDPSEKQQIKDFLCQNLPSLDLIETSLDLKPQIEKLVYLINKFTEIQKINENELIDLNEDENQNKKENLSITQTNSEHENQSNNDNNENHSDEETVSNFENQGQVENENEKVNEQGKESNNEKVSEKESESDVENALSGKEEEESEKDNKPEKASRKESEIEEESDKDQASEINQKDNKSDAESKSETENKSDKENKSAKGSSSEDENDEEEEEEEEKAEENEDNKINVENESKESEENQENEDNLSDQNGNQEKHINYSEKSEDENLEIQMKEPIKNYKNSLKHKKIMKRFILPDLILKQIDSISPYRDFPSRYSKFIELIGGSSDKSLKLKDFDNDLYNISLALFSLFNFDNVSFECNAEFFMKWLYIDLSIISNPDDYLYDNIIPSFGEIIPYCNFSWILPSTVFTFSISRNIGNQPSSLKDSSSTENNQAVTELIESLRSFVLTSLQNLEFDDSKFQILTKNVLEKTKKLTSLHYYRRLNNQITYIQSNIKLFLQINKLCSLLKKKYPDQTFDYKPLAFYNFVISIFKSLSSISNAQCLSNEYKEKLFDILERFHSVNECEKPPFFSSNYHILLEIVFPMIHEVKQLINSFDILPLVDVAYKYVYSTLEFHDTSNTSLTPEALTATLHLDLQAESLIHHSAIFQRNFAVSSILYTLFIIKDQPKQLREIYNLFRETAVSSFVNYNLHAIIAFVQHVFVQRFGIDSLYMTNNIEMLNNGIINHMMPNGEIMNENIGINNVLQIDPKVSQISEIIQPTIGCFFDLRPYIQHVSKELGDESNEIQELSMSLLQEVKNIILPYLEANNEIQELRKEDQQLIEKLRKEEELKRAESLEAEKSFMKTRNHCHDIRMKIENAVLNGRIMKIDIEQKRKHLVELKSQIEEKSREVAIKNEKTPPEMKQRQKQQFMNTIQALRELVGPPKNDPSQVNKLTQKLKELNEKNEVLKNKIREIESKHSTTQEDEIDLILMNENNIYYNDDKKNDAELENEVLKQQIEETSASINRIKKQLKKKGNNQFDENDTSLLKFLSSSRPASFTDCTVDFTAFQEVKNQTMERIEHLMEVKSQLIHELNLLDA